MSKLGVFDVLLPAPAAAIDAFTGPSKDAREKYAQLRKRWARLYDLKLREKAPDTRSQFDSWESFRDKWEDGDENVSAINAQLSDLGVAEKRAEDLGLGKAAPLPSFDIEQGTPALEAAARVERMAQDAGFPKDPTRLPWYFYAAGVAIGIIALAAGATAIRIYLPPARLR